MTQNEWVAEALQKVLDRRECHSHRFSPFYGNKFGLAARPVLPISDLPESRYVGFHITLMGSIVHTGYLHVPTRLSTPACAKTLNAAYAAHARITNG